MTGPCVYVNRSGDNVWSPNTKEQLCEAVEKLSADLAAARVEARYAWEAVQRLLAAPSPQEPS